VRLELVTADDVHLTGRRWTPRRPDAAAVVVVHGFGATSEEERVVALAEALHDAGHSVLAYDARGHGVSGGEATLGDRERLDVAAAVAAVRADGGPVVLVAASVGAIAALRHLADEPGSVAGVVTVSCPARWRLPLNARGVLSALLTQTWLGREVARRHMRVRIARAMKRGAPPIELIGRIATPVAIVHGRADPFISPADAEDLYDAAAEPQRLTLVDGMGHAFEAPAVAPVLESVDWILGQ
jgi:alpha-beta hydrolase superfamily lysophospholipase